MTKSPDLSHLHALELRLSHERDYLAQAKTERDKEFRRHQIRMVEKEIAGEKKFLGISADTTPDLDLSDDELLAELLAPIKARVI